MCMTANALVPCFCVTKLSSLILIGTWSLVTRGVTPPFRKLFSANGGRGRGFGAHFYALFLGLKMRVQKIDRYVSTPQIR